MHGGVYLSSLRSDKENLAMRKALISIQQEQLSQQQIRQLDALLQQHYRQHIGDERLLIIWNRLPAGQAFTKYEDSRSSLVTLECAKGLPQARRVAFMQALDKDWREITSQHPDELMLAVVEADAFASILSSSQQRLSLRGRLQLNLKMLRCILKARLSATPIQFNPNL